MNKNLVFGIIIVVGFIGGIYLLSRMDTDYNWSKSLNTYTDEPYNLTVLHKVLEGEYLIDNHSPLYESLHKYKGTNNCYFLLSSKCYLSDTEEIDSLLSFVGRGNKAFLCIDDFSNFTGNNSSIHSSEQEYEEAKEEAAREVIEEVEAEAAESERTNSWEQELEPEHEESQESSYYDDGESLYEEDSENDEATFNSSYADENTDQDDQDTIYDFSQFSSEAVTEYDPAEEEKEEEIGASSLSRSDYFFPIADSLLVKFRKYREDTITASININPNNNLSFTAKSIHADEDERSLRPETQNYYYIEESPQAVGLGKIDGHTNFIAVPYGKGTIYIHTNPVLLTNYVMIQDSGMKYVEDVFSVLSENDTIIWDHLNTHQHWHNRNHQKSEAREIKGPFSFIFDHRSLKYSWYSIIILTVVFLVFYARRVQRSVPIIDPKKNNSVEFAKTIGMLYLQANHHNYIVKYQMKYLLLFIKNKYRIQLKEDVSGFITDLSYRSELPEEDLSKMFSKYDSMKNRNSLTDNELLTFNTQINYFYSNCK